MKRTAMLALAIALTLGVAAPGQAAKPVKGSWENLSANAFWYTTDPVPGGGTRTTVWYVGVYQSSDFTFSDLYEDVYVCDASGQDCYTESSRFGFRDDLTADEFSMDSTELSWARFDAVFDLQAYDGEWEPVGDPSPVHIVADLTAAGDLMRGRGSYSFKSKCYSYRERFRDASRSAIATGTVDGVDLGSTDDAWMSAGTSRYFERTCD